MSELKLYEIQQWFNQPEPHGGWHTVTESYSNLADAQFDLVMKDQFQDENEKFRIIWVIRDEFANEIEVGLAPSKRPNPRLPLLRFMADGMDESVELDDGIRVYIQCRAFNADGEEVDAVLEYNFTTEGVIIDLHFNDESDEGEMSTSSQMYTDVIEELQLQHHFDKIADDFDKAMFS
jgi:hypothetical protein